MNTINFELVEFIEIVDEETGDTYFYCDDEEEPDFGTDVDALLAMITDM